MDKSLQIQPDSFKYADLNIRHLGNPSKTIDLLKRAIRMGYDALAVNIDIGDISVNVEDEVNYDPQPPPTKKKKKAKNGSAGREQTIPEPYLPDISLLDTTVLEQQGRRLRLFSRITFTLNDPSIIHNVFHNAQLKKYDIVAVRPGDENILSTLTRKTDSIDLICYDSAQEKVSWTFKAKHMEQIRTEGICFEISYNSVLTSRDLRRQALSHGRNVIRSLKSRGIVFTSAAQSVLDLRAPVDAMNMLKLWGVDGANARPMISGFPKQLLLRCEARKTVRGVLYVAPITKEEDEVKAAVPSSTMKSNQALKRLLSVKEFHAQVEIVKKPESSSEC